ncbi:MAG TPA: hypothetical protein PKC99_11510 [Anaerolineales bacterium]|jgi:hypothetical protein|nr:hypothetical protein [Anaerolineales bacterium]NOG75754.1 hypothetical protein [Chloroflexota bacterium]MCL4824026.1 hypothetical protein [Anaerolineales bacterium]MCZ2287378.1 hypothetical protein [Anaerolineales bacterium]MCZ7548686.1 hypothetical protein [Anaerolineales bacterium]
MKYRKQKDHHALSVMVSPIALAKKLSVWIADGFCANGLTTIHPAGAGGYSPNTARV